MNLSALQRMCRVEQLQLHQGHVPFNTAGYRRSPSSRPPMLSVLTRAKRGERHDFNVDSFVSFDSEDEWESKSSRVTPGAKPFVSQLFSAVGIVVDRLTDLAYSFVPEGVSVQVVRTAVGGGLLLVLLSFAKSVLGFFLTLGTLVLGAYVAVRILGIDLGGLKTDEPDEFKQAAKRRPAAPSSRSPRGRQAEFKGLLGGEPDEDGLLDVWFERNKGKYTRKGKK